MFEIWTIYYHSQCSIRLAPPLSNGSKWLFHKILVALPFCSVQRIAGKHTMLGIVRVKSLLNPCHVRYGWLKIFH